MNKSRKTSNLYNVLTYDEVGHVTAHAGLTLGTTPLSSDNSSKAASTAWIRSYVTGLSYATSASVSAAVAALVDAAPATLDTLNELAAALGDDPNFATTITTSLAGKLNLTGGTLTGGLYINPTNTGVTGLDVASNTITFRSDNLEGFKRQLTTTMGSGTLVRMQAAGFGGTYVTDLGFYTSSNSAVNATPNLYLTGGNNRVGINTTTPGFVLDVQGTAGVSGVLTLGSTISNGTFTYMLPGATGTLALVGGAGVGTVTSVALSVPTGLTVTGSPITSSGTLAITLTAGYSIPTTASQTNWDSAFTERRQWDGGSTNLVAATGRTSLGATTVGSNLFTLANPTAVRFVRINADNTVSALDAAAFRTAIGAGTSSTVGTVTSVAAITLGTTGTDLSSTVATGTTTPVITLNVPTASAANRGALSAADWTTFNAKQAALSGTGFVKIAGTTISYDNSTYLTTSSASSTYLALAGGTMTGKILAPSVADDVYGSAIEIRERGYVLAAQSAWSFSPAITFHWGNRAAIRFGLRSDGLMAVDDAPIALRSWVTAQAYLTGITSAQVTTALGYTPYNSTNPSGYITSSASVARLSSRDIRTISPSSENASELRFGFTSWNNNSGAPYADYLHLRSYSDNSGGADNLVTFLKSGIGMRIWQQSFGSGTAYSSYVDVLHSSNYTSYAIPIGGSWGADLTNVGWTRRVGVAYDGGEWVVLTNNNQISTLIDGSYFAGENGGFWSLGAANQYASRRGWYNDGSTINFRTNNAVLATANIRVYPVSESWGEGLSFMMPTTTTWGGLRWRRERANNDGNWGIGYTALDATDDLVFVANNGGSQIDNILRLRKDGSIFSASPVGTDSHGRSYTFRCTQSAAGNYTPILFQSDFGNHSYGIIARFFIAQAGADRPSIQFAYGGSDNRWAVGYCFPDDNFRITQNHGFNNSGVDNAWGSERFKIDTGGTLWTNGVMNFGPDSGADNGIGIRYGSASYGRIRFYQDGANSSTIHSFGTGWQSNNVATSGGCINITGSTGVTFGGWNVPDAYIVSGGSAWFRYDVTAYSDSRVKDNVEVIQDPLEKLKAIRGVSFTRKDYTDKSKKYMGVIAQELLPVLPEVVTEDSDGMYSVSYGNMAGVFIEAIKEQQSQIEAQQSEIAELKDLVKQLLAK